MGVDLYTGSTYTPENTVLDSKKAVTTILQTVIETLTS